MTNENCNSYFNFYHDVSGDGMRLPLIHCRNIWL